MFEDWEVSVAGKLCAEFIAKYPWIKGLEIEDLLQECLLHWYLVREGYSPGKGSSRATYMSSVLRHLLSDMLDQQMADRRKGHHLAVSLEQSAAEATEGALEIIADGIDPSLRPDLEKALAALTPLQRRICRLLAEEYPVIEVARTLGKQRSAVYRELGQIKKVFREHGLNQYLK